MANEFFWYDVMTTDTDAAAGFYCDVVGWATLDAGQTDQDYTLFTAGGVAVAGLMKIPQIIKDHAQPCWRGYIAVDDVDRAVRAIEAAGGIMHRAPQIVPGVICFAVVADPQGAVFLVAKSLSPQTQPELALGTAGTIGWRELYAGEWKSAFGFYEKVFGWTKADSFDMGSMGTYQLFAAGGPPIGGMMSKPDVVPVPNWGYYINVEAIDGAVDRVKAAGGSILMGPREVPGGQWIVQCLDPQGGYFALVALKR
jgi:uncharacterized protein